MEPSPDDRNHRVRFVTCSAIPPELHAKLEERWGVPWYEAFGMTESGGDIAVWPEEHDELVGSGCIGRPLPHKEARIVDEADCPVPRGAVGELVVRGPGMMDGYYKDEEATRALFRNGWLHTGDRATMDEAGRIKDMIRRSGENISASEVEEVLHQHPGLRLAACLAVPDDLRGEEVKAYVVLNAGFTREQVHPESLVDYCKGRLAYFKVPRYWEYSDDLPRTPSERIAKAILRQAKPDLRIGAYDAVARLWR
jgi:crotonobetaine/carnitine-CoA ligase